MISVLEKTMIVMFFLNKRDTLEWNINQLSFKGFFPDFQGNEKDMSDVIELNHLYEHKKYP